MIPLESATAILPRMPTGRSLPTEFPLTIIKPPIVDTKCRSNSPAVSSPIYRLLRSRNQRRNSSASSVHSTLSKKIECREHVTERVEVFQLKDSTSLHSHDHVESVWHQDQNQSKCTLCPNKGYCQEKSPTSRENSLNLSANEDHISVQEEPSELTPELNDEDGGQQCNLTNLISETQQTDDSLITEDKPSEKAKKSIKCKTFKVKKTNKKRKKCLKKGVAMSGVFARMVGHGHSSSSKQQGQHQKVEQEVNLQKTLRDPSPNKYLSINKIQAAYAPKKKEIKSNRAVILPRVSNTSLTNENTRSCTSSPRKQEQEQEQESIPTCSPPYHLSSPHKLLNSHDNNKVKKVYLSESHSGMITGIPCAPPSTPTVEELQKVKYIPSLTDVKSQRAVKSKLVNLGNKLRAEEQRKKEKALKEEQRKAYGAILQLKQRQRAEIYALNKVMTELENDNFRKFMEEKSAEMLSV